jgi:hypothetical protein
MAYLWITDGQWHDLRSGGRQTGISIRLFKSGWSVIGGSMWGPTLHLDKGMPEEDVKAYVEALYALEGK